MTQPYSKTFSNEMLVLSSFDTMHAQIAFLNVQDRVPSIESFRNKDAIVLLKTQPLQERFQFCHSRFSNHRIVLLTTLLENVTIQMYVIVVSELRP